MVMWLLRFLGKKGGTFKFVTERRWDQEALPSVAHNLLGFVLELSTSYGQLDGGDLAMLEVIARLYQVLDESGGRLHVEELAHYFGRDRTSGLWNGITLGPNLEFWEKDGAKGAAEGAREPQ